MFDLGVTTKEATGHGIGLALVRQTVTRLGGGVRVLGSTFEVTLPLVNATTPPVTIPATPAASEVDVDADGGAADA